MGTEYLYENVYDMIDAAVDEHLETEEDLIFNAHEDEIEGEVIDALITPEDEEKAKAAIAIEDSYEQSQEETEDDSEIE